MTQESGEESKSLRKQRKGVVVSSKMEKTAVVRVERTVRHPRYEKVVTRWKKYYAHCEEPVITGQKVKIEETRPISKLKRWRVVSVEA